MHKILNNKKLLIIVIIFLAVIFALSLILLLLKLSSANSTHNDNVMPSYAVSYSVSYPISYSISDVLEPAEIIPLNAADLIKTIKTEYYCGDENNANLGIVTYRFSTGDFSSHDENYKLFIINNRTTVQGVNQQKNFDEVIDIIDNKKDIVSLNDLPVFTTACTGNGGGSFIKTFDVDFPAVDKSIAYIYVGGTQYVWASLNDVKFTLKILSQKGDNVMLMSEYFEGSQILTEEQVSTCLTESEYSYSYLPMECIRDLYKQTPGIQEIVNQKAEDLIKFFAF